MDVCYELRSYERGVAQLGCAGALKVMPFNSEITYLFAFRVKYLYKKFSYIWIKYYF